MIIGIYLLIMGAISFVGGMVGIAPKIFIFIGVIIMIAGLIVTTTREAIMSAKLDDLEDKVRALEERRKEDGTVH